MTSESGRNKHQIYPWSLNPKKSLLNSTLKRARTHRPLFKHQGQQKFEFTFYLNNTSKEINEMWMFRITSLLLLQLKNTLFLAKPVTRFTAVTQCWHQPYGETARRWPLPLPHLGLIKFKQFCCSCSGICCTKHRLNQGHWGQQLASSACPRGRRLVGQPVLCPLKVRVKSLSRVRLFATQWTVAHQAPLSMGFSRHKHCSELPFPPPGDFPYPGIQPRSLTLQADSSPSKPLRQPASSVPCLLSFFQWALSTLASAFPVLHVQFLHCTPAARPFSGAELYAAQPSHPPSQQLWVPYRLQVVLTPLAWEPIWRTLALSFLWDPKLCHATSSLLSPAGDNQLGTQLPRW